MIHLKSSEEIEIMKVGGHILSDTLMKLIDAAKPGVRVSDLDEMAEKYIKSRGAEPSFHKVKNYHWTICACINDIVVHGIPTDYILKPQDIFGIDCGVYYKGFHTDAAWTIRVGNGSLSDNEEKDKFLSAGERAFFNARDAAVEGNHIQDISKAIQTVIEGAGYSVVKTLVGHGVGRNLHEEPEIPGIVRSKNANSPLIIPGMVLAIEVIYNMGGNEVVYQGDDGWTIVTKDGKISGLFESTVAIINHGSIVLTPIGSELNNL